MATKQIKIKSFLTKLFNKRISKKHYLPIYVEKRIFMTQYIAFYYFLRQCGHYGLRVYRPT